MADNNPTQSYSADRQTEGAGFVRDKPRIIVVAGPTASGKSALAIRLARKFDGEIVSADSRQVYRGMDIGTGKVTKQERKLVRHWMLDVASPRRQDSVARFKRDAAKAIRDITRRGKIPIICGGTGFWIDTLVYGHSLPPVKPNTKLRARLERQTAPELLKRLAKLDPVRAGTIDRHNRRRLIRALEIVMATGKPVPARTNGSPYEPLYLGVSRPMSELKRRITKRLDARLKAGMIAEVRRVHSFGVSWQRLESFGLEYRWVARFLRGSTSERERLNLKSMRDGLERDIIAYAKRQMTWWRKNPDIVWVSSTIRAERLSRKFLAQ